MRNKKIVATSALVAAVGLTAAACSSSGSSGSGGSNGGTSAAYNAALTGVVNASTSQGNSVVYNESSSMDSIDPGNTYEAMAWDLVRTYDRTMLAFQQKPGAAGLQVVGDLATGLGTPSNGAKTWTYHIVPNAKFSDGTTITTADIKYAVERSNWGHEVLSNGPSYFKALVQDNTKYQGPYKDTNANDGVSGIETPNATTIVFNLTQPFADFDYLMTMSQTAPVERSKDKGATYYQNMVFSGAYQVQSYTPDKQLVIVPNPNFDAGSDPNGLHKVHAKKITLNFKVAATTVDQSVVHGQAQIDSGGRGVQTATQSQILSNPTLKANADDALNGFETYLAINTQLTPFTNIDCRKAVEWAVNKQQVQTVDGGAVGGGQIATTLLPTANTGYAQSDIYKTPAEQGDVDKAKQEVATCKAALGSAYNPSFAIASYSQSDDPKAVAAADVVQQNLNAIGFNVSIDQFPFSSLNSTYAGLPSYAQAHRIGMTVYAWGADFPTGYGYMDQILTKDGINQGGGTYDLSYWDDPTFDGYVNQALAETNASNRAADYAKADQYAMTQAVIVPLLYQTALLYRSPSATNVYFSEAYGMYDYAMIGSNN